MAYVPERGDIVWVTLDPRKGHEQAGRRPALVMSPRSYNAKVGMALMCPITRQAKGYPFEVAVPAESELTGVVLADHIRNLDWKARRVDFMARASEVELTEVVQKLLSLLR